MQKIYGYLAGLYVKMILTTIYNFDATRLDKYIKRFIKSRSSVGRLTFCKNYNTYKTQLKNRKRKK